MCVHKKLYMYQNQKLGRIMQLETLIWRIGAETGTAHFDERWRFEKGIDEPQYLNGTTISAKVPKKNRRTIANPVKDFQKKRRDQYKRWTHENFFRRQNLSDATCRPREERSLLGNYGLLVTISSYLEL
jgi:hypothetical protein